jgi:hypothetical protein
VLPPKICRPLAGCLSTAFRLAGSVQGTKNLSADPVLATRHLSHYFKSGASFAPHRSGCQRFIFAFQPLDLPASQQAFRRTGRETTGVAGLRKLFFMFFSISFPRRSNRPATSPGHVETLGRR